MRHRPERQPDGLLPGQPARRHRLLRPLRATRHVAPRREPVRRGERQAQVLRPVTGRAPERSAGRARSAACAPTSPAEEGICTTMIPCTEDKDCKDPVRSTCAATFLTQLYSKNTTLEADNLYCLQKNCQSGASSCSPGQSCLPLLVPAAAHPPDICVPNCDSAQNCPPNSGLLPADLGTGQPGDLHPGAARLHLRDGHQLPGRQVPLRRRSRTPTRGSSSARSSATATPTAPSSTATRGPSPASCAATGRATARAPTRTAATPAARRPTARATRTPSASFRRRPRSRPTSGPACARARWPRTNDARLRAARRHRPDLSPLPHRGRPDLGPGSDRCLLPRVRSGCPAASNGNCVGDLKCRQVDPSDASTHRSARRSARSTTTATPIAGAPGSRSAPPPASARLSRPAGKACLKDNQCQSKSCQKPDGGAWAGTCAEPTP